MVSNNTYNNSIGTPAPGRRQTQGPRIDDIINMLCNYKIFSTLDATSGYYQIKLDEKDRKKNSDFMKMAKMSIVEYLWVCNAPATFQRIMDNVILK